MGYRDEIRREVLGRNIERILHFTPAENTQSILIHGLGARTVLEEHGVDALYTDSRRLDEQLDAVSLSIDEINYSMLKAKKKLYNGPWVILGLSRSVLWTHSCRFCWHNAASKEIRNHTGFMGGPWALNKMFESRPVSILDKRCQREVYELHDAAPTDNAAEVQVFDPIDSDLIEVVGVRTRREKEELEALMIEIDQVRPVELVPDLLA